MDVHISMVDRDVSSMLSVVGQTLTYSIVVPASHWLQLLYSGWSAFGLKAGIPNSGTSVTLHNEEDKD